MIDMYRQVADATAFVRGDGSRLRSLKALEMALLTMPESEFTNHVNVSKNDFANWVQHVFMEPALADRLRSSPSRISMLAALDEASRERKTSDRAEKQSRVESRADARSESRSRDIMPRPEPLAASHAHSSAAQSASSSKPLHHKLKGIFKKGDSHEHIPEQQAHDAHTTHRHSLHAQIEYLDKDLAHLTKHHRHTTARDDVGSALLEESVRERILDFALGLVVGLMLGFILAKSFGM